MSETPATPPAYPGPDAAAAPGYAPAPLGQVRGTGFGILMMIVTLGIYGLYWNYSVHEEMKRHSGDGVGGVLALVISFVFAVMMPFQTSAEVGNLYQRVGRERPVTAVTGLWVALGWLILVGPIVWFVKTNRALNAYWVGMGATAR